MEKVHAAAEVVPDAESAPVTLSRPQVERLYRDHNEVLLNFLRARLHNEADAREAAQEAYVRLLKLDKPEQPSFLRAYLFKIASNVATDLIRRRGVRGVSVPPEDCILAEPALQERDTSARQQLAIVEYALQELPPRCREAFLLSRFEGWTSESIAIHLGVSDRMVRLYMVRALEHLRDALSNAFSGGDVR